MHIRDLRRLSPILDHKTACKIVHSMLDYCNSLFYSINSSQIKRLQRIQNALARAITKTTKHHHITSVLKSLHWLKLPQRIHYKIASHTYNTLQTSQPSYIRQFLTIQPPGSTRSSSYLSLSRPLVSSSLKFCNVPLSTLHQFFGTNSQKTSVSLHILITHLLISPILRSHSPLLHSTHD